MMRLHLDKPTDHVEVYYQDRLLGEVCVGILDTEGDLRREVDRARTLEALPVLLGSALSELCNLTGLEDHNHPPGAKREVAFLRGLADGLLCRTVPHPDAGVPALFPGDGSPTYERGYHAGEAIARALSRAGG